MRICCGVMHLSKWVYILALSYTGVILAGRVDEIFIKDDKPTLKGSSVQIVCVGEFPFNRLNDFYIYKEDNVASIFPKSAKDMFPFSERYQGNSNYTTASIVISDLERSEDQKWWICAFGNQTKQLRLTVYTPPEGLTLDESQAGEDLQEEAVILTCETTNCIYPEPQTFQWFYKDIKETDAPWLFYQNTTPSMSKSSCNDSEERYTSSLHLPKYTTWPLQPLDTEISVKFQCRMGFPALQSQLQSDYFGIVKYAVQVRNVTLKDGDCTPYNTLHVILGNAKTLTCDTSISKPKSTILWYIGTAERHRSSYNSTFTFIPQNNDNSKQIYCKAFNIQPEEQAVTSQNVTLNVLDSDQRQTDKESSYRASDNTSLIVGLIILGTVCCIVTVYAIYVTVSRHRLLRKAAGPLGNQVIYPNATFAQDVTNTERYDGNTSSNQEVSD